MTSSSTYNWSDQFSSFYNSLFSLILLNYSNNWLFLRDEGFFDEILDSDIVPTDGLLYQSMIHHCVFSIYGRVALSNRYRIWPMWVDRFLPVCVVISLLRTVYIGQWVVIFENKSTWNKSCKMTFIRFWI